MMFLILKMQKKALNLSNPQYAEQVLANVNEVSISESLFKGND